MSAALLHLFLLLAFLLSAVLIYLVARRIEKGFAGKGQKWSFFAFSVLALVEAARVLFREPGALSSKYFWFWVLLWGYCVGGFWLSRRTKTGPEKG
jgi:hypothetical protein